MPCAVSALQDVKSTLEDPLNHLQNWDGGDPCTSNWTGVLCFDKVDNDGYLHVRELYVLFDPHHPHFCSFYSLKMYDCKLFSVLNDDVYQLILFCDLHPGNCLI